MRFGTKILSGGGDGNRPGGAPKSLPTVTPPSCTVASRRDSDDKTASGFTCSLDGACSWTGGGAASIVRWSIHHVRLLASAAVLHCCSAPLSLACCVLGHSSSTDCSRGTRFWGAERCCMVGPAIALPTNTTSTTAVGILSLHAGAAVTLGLLRRRRCWRRCYRRCCVHVAGYWGPCVFVRPSCGCWCMRW